MGTRNLTIIIHKGKNVVAQYGQWDGYPNGQGKKALAFCRTIAKSDARKKFIKKLSRCRWATDVEIKAAQNKVGIIDDWMNLDQAEQLNKLLPYLSRDNGAAVLDMIMKSKRKDGDVLLTDSTEFAADSVFCEWAYVIDLDNRKLEVYKGFNVSPLPKGERFQYLTDTVDQPDHRKGKSREYWPVRHVMTYSFGKLPKFEKFVEECSPSEDEE